MCLKRCGKNCSLHTSESTMEIWEATWVFYKKWDFPNWTGSINGKHVAPKCPKNSVSPYFFHLTEIFSTNHGNCWANLQIHLCTYWRIWYKQQLGRGANMWWEVNLKEQSYKPLSGGKIIKLQIVPYQMCCGKCLQIDPEVVSQPRVTCTTILQPSLTILSRLVWIPGTFRTSSGCFDWNGNWRKKWM